MILGCFRDDDLQRAGISHAPPKGVPLPSHDSIAAVTEEGRHLDLAMRCGAACDGYTYFAVGSARLVGGPCLCGDMSTVTWRRDAEGIEPLKRRTLRPH